MQQRGFTLIELVIVIVILGILAVTAAPRFINLQADARAASLEGVAAALQGGAQLVYAKAAIAGQQNATDAAVDLNNDTTADVTADYGYPDAAANDAFTELADWVELNIATDDSADFRFTASGSTPDPGANSFAISPSGTAFNSTAGSECYVLYTSPTNPGVAPTVEVFSDGC